MLLKRVAAGRFSAIAASFNPSINTDAGDKAAGGYVKRWAFIQTMVNGVNGEWGQTRFNLPLHVLLNRV